MKVWLIRIQLLLLVGLLLVAGGHKFGLIAFSVLAKGFMVCLAGLVLMGALALLVLAWALITRRPGWSGPMCGALILAVLPLVVMVLTVGDGFKKPRIHDITTDTDNPPEFIAARKQRLDTDNSLDYDRQALVGVQLEAYPAIGPQQLSLPVAQAFELVQRAVDTLGWKVLRVDAVSGELEAIDETLILGFKDDVIVRVTAVPEGSRIDVRSVSRVGLSDLGANAKRIERFYQVLQEGL